MIYVYEIPDLWRQYLDAIEVDEETGEVIKPEGFDNLILESEEAVMYRARYARELEAEQGVIKRRD